ncbi:MAG: ATP-binding cassette domain-containing protein [Mobilibacterium timonense]|uniref:ABC transporter ATP-binding protein n=1 Tax=Mobilibacterium timonense TaxID=1871012 RepID=UPI0023570167|nr:ATP-binding cassette domain-containing protein [Mobilibacterium timonense]MBM6991070.1 ATP-binding cassette domain-containing protein [Mobilibacterium timonense]
MSAYIIEGKNISKSFDSTVALKDLDIHVPYGSIYGLIGINGAGKSTLMKILVGLEAMDSGSLRIFDQNEMTSEGLDSTGSIIEYPYFYEHLTGLENLQLHASYMGFHDMKRIAEVLEQTGLTGSSDRKVMTFSLGMRQRLAIARAILTYPELLILDEPTNALDPEGIKDMRTLFRDINLNYGTTIIISSHILSEMEHLADWIGIIDQHRIVQEKTMDEIKKANRDHLTISVDDVKKSCVILEHLGITDFTVQENNSIRIYQNTDPSIIAKKLVNAGVSLYELSQANRTLEDHFFEVLQNGGGI